ncbi:MAG: hypothetical protein KGZ82_04285 [Bacteroidales bacterium]|nr:hypothetical protein [Bacteroidales bacterium]
MSDTFQWKGRSGNHYNYQVFPINQRFDQGILGNYIFARRDVVGWWAIYIGEGDIDQRTQDATHRNCAIQKGATHIHAHINSNELRRKEEEKDLLDGNDVAYSPMGCNKKAGG